MSQFIRNQFFLTCMGFLMNFDAFHKQWMDAGLLPLGDVSRRPLEVDAWLPMFRFGVALLRCAHIGRNSSTPTRPFSSPKWAWWVPLSIALEHLFPTGTEMPCRASCPSFFNFLKTLSWDCQSIASASREVHPYLLHICCRSGGPETAMWIASACLDVTVPTQQEMRPRW